MRLTNGTDTILDGIVKIDFGPSDVDVFEFICTMLDGSEKRLDFQGMSVERWQHETPY